MIGKITTGKGAGGTVSYVTQKDGAQILSSSWAGGAETWAAQFKEHSSALNPALTEHGQSVVHVSLSADPKDGRLSDDQWRAVAAEYLSRMGWGEHDHAVVRHTDTDHDHVHIIVSRVGHDGQTADLHKDYERQERVLDSLERDFGLTRTHEQIRIEAEKDPFRAVESATRGSLTFDRERIERY
ncbi:mobilization protein BmgA, partial [mine drainage metagenome]